MRKLIVLGLLAVPSLTLSQEFPKVTKVGQKAANTLLTAFVKAGGLKVETDRKTKQRLMVVADSKKLRELVKQRRNDFTPAVRDALLRRFAHPGVVAVLLVAGEEKGDEQAMAFGHLFAADIAEEQLRYREARQDYERASKLFEGLKMAAWQATVLSNLATVCQAQRDLSEAHTFCQKALQLRREIHGERHPNVAGSLNNLASICKDQGDLAQARKFAQQALDLSKQLHGERHPLVATSLNNLAMIRAAQGDLAQARKLCQQALDLRRQIHGERHPHVAASLHNLAGVCRAQGDLAQARTLSEQALALRRQIHGERHPDVAGSLANLAMVCRAQGNLAQARTLCQQALDLRRQLHGERHPDVATSLNHLALICQDQGDLAQARTLCQQALDLRRQLHGERHAAVATALDNLALICRAQGDLAQARTLHQQALELTRQIHGERHPNIAASLNNLGSVCHEQGDLPQARKLHQQALGLLKQIHGARHRNIAASLSNLAMVCKDQGDLAQARKFSQQALELAMQIHTERHPDVANALNGLALVCYDQGDLPRARKFAQQALDMYKQLHGARHPAVATSLNNLALVCYDQGDLPQARKLHQQALELYKELHGERHPHVANSLHNLAVVCRVQGNLPSAVRFLTEAVLASRLPGIAPENMAALRPQDFTCDANTVGRLHDLGLTIQLSGKRDDASAARQAATAYALAADLLDRLRADVLESEEGKLFQGAKRAAVVPARVALAATLFALDGKAADLHVALTALEQGRARVFLQALAQARSRQLGGVSGTLLDQERDLLGHLRGIDARIRKENAKTLDQRNADLVKQLYDQRQQKETQLNQLVQRMRQEHPQYAALQYPQPCSLHQARDCLAANEVAVLFALDEKQSWAVVVQKTPAADDKGQGVAVVELPGTDVLGPRVRTLVDAEVLTSDSRTRRLGAELYGLLLQPLQKHIDGKDLLVVPDGVLWELPFELLVQGRTPERDGKYLIESRQVRYTPSLTVLHLVRQWEGSRKAPTEPLWALADPVFSKDDPRARGDLSRPTRDLLELYARRSGSGDGFARLPGTRREVESIARLHGARKGDVVLDTLASEKVLKTASAGGVLARKRYVHLATHGILASQLGRPPSLVLSLVCNDGAEQGGGVNDGFLSLVEVTHLKLNADLVVLSACATGRGDLRPGEGVVGLSRAFLYAGSRGVVCSLWQVDDARTARLMQALYAELKKGTPSREALTAARRSLIAAEEAPLFWAPFILIGQ